jgi:hypothetical protein
MTSVLGLSAREAASLPTLSRGVALVRYGAARSVVQLTLSERDRRIADSDAAMRSAPSERT